MNQRMLIGGRLREERERLGLNQDALGVTPQAQRKYEKGISTPGADYLSELAEMGGDVLYIVTGRRSVTVVSDEDATMLDAFHAAPEAVKKAALAALLSGAMPSLTTMTILGDVGTTVSGGTTHIHAGIIKTKK